MTTRITIDTYGTHVTVQVTDDTGRYEVRKFPRYPDEGSAPYVRFVDVLDVMMASQSASVGLHDSFGEPS